MHILKNNFAYVQVKRHCVCSNSGSAVILSMTKNLKNVQISKSVAKIFVCILHICICVDCDAFLFHNKFLCEKFQKKKAQQMINIFLCCIRLNELNVLIKTLLIVGMRLQNDSKSLSDMKCIL